MAKFDLYRLPGPLLVVDCQSDHVDGYETRTVIPLMPPGRDRAPARRLEPLLRVGDHDLILTTHLLAAVDRYTLGKPVGSIEHHREAIGSALDMLIYGF